MHTTNNFGVKKGSQFNSQTSIYELHDGILDLKSMLTGGSGVMERNIGTCQMNSNKNWMDKIEHFEQSL